MPVLETKKAKIEGTHHRYLFHGFVTRKNLVVFVIIFGMISIGNLAYAQVTGENVSVAGSPAASTPDWANLLASELIAGLSGLVGLGVAALIAWLRNKGIPITTEQEAMFRSIVTKRFEKLAKESWTEMRDNPDKMDEYWTSLRQGKIPAEFQQRLKKEGFDFAMELKENKEFGDFGRKISEDAMQRLLKDLRAGLKNEYQQRMLDVLPKMASTAVDSAFDPGAKDVNSWSLRALENLKPLLFSTEAIDKEENLMILIKSEINRRIQAQN